MLRGGLLQDPNLQVRLHFHTLVEQRPTFVLRLSAGCWRWTGPTQTHWLMRWIFAAPVLGAVVATSMVQSPLVDDMPLQFRSNCKSAHKPNCRVSETLLVCSVSDHLIAVPCNECLDEVELTLRRFGVLRCLSCVAYDLEVKGEYLHDKRRWEGFCLSWLGRKAWSL